MRRSEIAGLKWNAVDPRSQTLQICNKIIRVIEKGKVVSYESNNLKTDSSNRTFMLNNYVLKYLIEHYNRQQTYIRATDEYLDYICVNEIGELLQPDFVSHKFKKILAQYNLRPIRFHDLRHSCLSLLVSKNINMKLVQEYAGHADFTTTANIYAHVEISAKMEEIDTITTS